MAWTNHREEVLPPIVVLSQQQIKDLFPVVQEFIASPKADLVIEDRLTISVKTENRDEFKLDTIDDIFAIPNRRHGLISGISIIGIGRGGRLVLFPLEIAPVGMSAPSYAMENLTK